MGATHGLVKNANANDDGHWNNGVSFNNLEELKHYFKKEKQEDSKQSKNVLVIGNNSDAKYSYFKYLNVYNALKKDNIGKRIPKKDIKVQNELFGELDKKYDKEVEEKMKKRFLSVRMALLSIKMISDEILIATDVINIVMDYYESIYMYGLKCNDNIECIKLDTYTVSNYKRNKKSCNCKIHEICCAFCPTITNMSNIKVLVNFACDLDKTGEIDCIIFVVCLMDYKSNKIQEMIDLYGKLKHLQCLKYIQLTRLVAFIESLETGVKQDNDHLKKYFSWYKLLKNGPKRIECYSSCLFSLVSLVEFQFSHQVEQYHPKKGYRILFCEDLQETTISDGQGYVQMSEIVGRLVAFLSHKGLFTPTYL